MNVIILCEYNYITLMNVHYVTVVHSTAPGTLGNLTSHLCWAWSAGSENMHNGYLNNDRQEPSLTLKQYLLTSYHQIIITSHQITSHHGFLCLCAK